MIEFFLFFYTLFMLKRISILVQGMMYLLHIMRNLYMSSLLWLRAFSALTLLVGRQEGYRAFNNNTLECMGTRYSLKYCVDSKSIGCRVSCSG